MQSITAVFIDFFYASAIFSFVVRGGGGGGGGWGRGGRQCEAYRGGGGQQCEVVSPLSVRMSILSVHNKNGFSSISFEKICVLVSNFIHRYIIIKYRSFSI